MFGKELIQGLRENYSETGILGLFKVNGKKGSGDSAGSFKSKIMENNWEPRVGQKVVALETSFKTYDMQIIKGKIYTVEQCFQCKCGKWVVCLLELFNKWEPIDIFCHMTGGVWKYAGGPTSKFAPIEYYPDQTSEIAQQFKEHPDTVDQPVKVLETSN